MAFTFSDKAVIIGVYLLISLSGMAGFGYVYLSLIGYSPPIRWETSTISTQTARAGDVIGIGRTYTVEREVPVSITRILRQVDCAKHCRVYPLPQNQMTIPAGHYDNVIFEHKIPDTAPSGVYEFRFQTLWQNNLGKWYSEDMPVLKVTVVR